MIDLPANFITDILTNAGALFDDFKVLLFLVCGVLMALGIASRILSRGKNEDNN